MEFAFRRASAKRGAVYHLPKVKFGDKTKAKYCILMEDYTDGAQSLIVLFTTHRTEYAYQPTSVLVEDKAFDGIDGDTLIQCENWRELPSDIILYDKRVRFVDDLPAEVMARIDDALSHVRNIDEEILIRMVK